MSKHTPSPPETAEPPSEAVYGAALRGTSQLLINAVTGITSMIEEMHRNIADPMSLTGKHPEGGAHGVAGLVYSSVRGVTKGVGSLLDLVLAQLGPLLPTQPTTARREALVSALNGVLGDFLLETGNPLSIQMRLRQEGSAINLDAATLKKSFADSNGRVLVMIHGLCMSDLGWHRHGHDHGHALAEALGYTPLYLHYNSGQHISSNGRELAALLETLVANWPVAIRDLTIIGHSMGGLVARSACYYAQEAAYHWPEKLKHLVFLGTPHHGAPLEQAGNRINLLIGVSPYTAPLNRLGMIRSAGIRDLRFGTLLKEDREGLEENYKDDPRQIVPLPEGVACFAIAATKSRISATRLSGDGLVTVRSALGQHKNSALTLSFPQAHQALVYETDHFDLLSTQEVYQKILGWLR